MAASPSIPLEQADPRPGPAGVVWDGGDLAYRGLHGYEPYQKRRGRRRPVLSRPRLLACTAAAALASLTAMAVLAPASRAQAVRHAGAASGPAGSGPAGRGPAVSASGRAAGGTAVAAGAATANGPRVPEITAVPPVSGHALPWEPEARRPFPGGPSDQLNIWLAEGEASSRALPYERPPVLFVGDSITQWWTTNGRASWDRWFAPLGAADDGVVADTTSNVLARLDAGQVPPASPKVTVLMIGTNNVALGQTPPAIVRGIQAVVAALHRHLPGSRIIVLGLLPRDAEPDAYRAETAAINALLSRTARSWHADYLDVGPALLRADGRFVPGVMLADFLHPSAAGYALMSGPILRAIGAARP